MCFINPPKKCRKVTWHRAISVSLSGFKAASEDLWNERRAASFSEGFYNQTRMIFGAVMEKFWWRAVMEERCSPSTIFWRVFRGTYGHKNSFTDTTSTNDGGCFEAMTTAIIRLECCVRNVRHCSCFLSKYPKVGSLPFSYNFFNPETNLLIIRRTPMTKDEEVRIYSTRAGFLSQETWDISPLSFSSFESDLFFFLSMPLLLLPLPSVSLRLVSVC